MGVQLMAEPILHRREEIFAAAMKAYAHAHATKFQAMELPRAQDGGLSAD